MIWWIYVFASFPEFLDPSAILALGLVILMKYLNWGLRKWFYCIYTHLSCSLRFHPSSHVCIGYFCCSAWCLLPTSTIRSNFLCTCRSRKREHLRHILKRGNRQTQLYSISLKRESDSAEDFNRRYPNSKKKQVFIPLFHFGYYVMILIWSRRDF